MMALLKAVFLLQKVRRDFLQVRIKSDTKK